MGPPGAGTRLPVAPAGGPGPARHRRPGPGRRRTAGLLIAGGCALGAAGLTSWATGLVTWSHPGPPHRVIQPLAERYSVAFFLDPNPDAPVETLPGMAAKYPPTTGAEYLKMKLDASYAHRTEAS